MRQLKRLRKHLSQGGGRLDFVRGIRQRDDGPRSRHSVYFAGTTRRIRPAELSVTR